MLVPIYLLSAVALSAAATPSSAENRYIAFKAQHGFQWSTPTETTPVTGECGNGQTMVIRDIQAAAQSTEPQLSILFCHGGDPTAAETQKVLGEALADLQTHGARAITDTARRAKIMDLLQCEKSSLQ